MLDFLFDVFEKQGHSLFFVGGYVRDYILHELDCELLQTKKPFVFSDIDFATSARPNEIVNILVSNGLAAIPIGFEFGTIQTILENDLKVEITTFRSEESYKKGSRKPSVVFGNTIEEDLARRDFTINAIAMDRNGKYIDPFYGVNALIMGLLKCPIDPEVSFSDDPLRMLRACRFHSKYAGISNLELKVMTEFSSKIHEISVERIFEEINKILLLPDPTCSLLLMEQTGLIKEIFPELQKVVDFKQNQGRHHSKLVWPHTLQVVQSCPPISEIRWAALFHDVSKPDTYEETETGVHFYLHEIKGADVWDNVAVRLKVGNDFKDYVHILILEHLQPSLLAENGADHCKTSTLRRFIHRLGNKLDSLFSLSFADITSSNPKTIEEKSRNCLDLKKRIDKIRLETNICQLKLPKGTGTLLENEFNIKGKQLGEVMKQLTQMLIDGQITLESNFVEEARKLL